MICLTNQLKSNCDTFAHEVIQIENIQYNICQVVLPSLKIIKFTNNFSGRTKLIRFDYQPV